MGLQPTAGSSVPPTHKAPPRGLRRFLPLNDHNTKLLPVYAPRFRLRHSLWKVSGTKRFIPVV